LILFGETLIINLDNSANRQMRDVEPLGS